MANQFSEELDRSSRRITFTIFIIIVGFFAVAFRFVPIPSREDVDESLDILMLEFYEMEAVEVEEGEEVEEDEPSDEIELEPETQPENINKLLSAFGELSLSEVKSDDILPMDPAPESPFGLESDVNLDMESGPNDLGIFGNSRTTDLNADLLPQSGGGSDRWTLKPNLVSGSSAANQPGFRTRNQTGVSANALAVRQEQPDDLFDEVYEEGDRSEMTREESEREDAVIEWFTENGSPLDPGIRSLFEQISSTLTAKVSVRIGAQTYSVQLMYSQHSRKLHIAFSEDKDLFYFIDPKLQNIANYYAKGVVVYDEAARIVIVESEELSVENPESVRVYRSFLSWWIDQIKAHG